MEKQFFKKKNNDSQLTMGGQKSALYTYNWNFRQKIFNYFILTTGVIIILLLSGIFISLLQGSLPAIKKFGLSFIYKKEWNPVFDKFGALLFLIGTLLTSSLALLISLIFSISLAVFLGEYLKKGYLYSILKGTTDLLAAIPSVIYGFWGLFVIVPIIRIIELKLNINSYGVGIFSASLILAIMIIPYSASIAREVIELVPVDIKEAAYALGATRYEVIRKIIFPYSYSGIFAGIILSLGRALGETMAVTMLIGNTNFLPTSIFSPANTMASVIANEFAEATSEIYTASLIEIGLLLLIVTMIINILGKYIIKKYSVEVRQR